MKKQQYKIESTIAGVKTTVITTINAVVWIKYETAVEQIKLVKSGNVKLSFFPEDIEIKSFDLPELPIPESTFKEH